MLKTRQYSGLFIGELFNDCNYSCERMKNGNQAIEEMHRENNGPKKKTNEI